MNIGAGSPATDFADDDHVGCAVHPAQPSLTEPGSRSVWDPWAVALSVALNANTAATVATVCVTSFTLGMWSEVGGVPPRRVGGTDRGAMTPKKHGASRHSASVAHASRCVSGRHHSEAATTLDVMMELGRPLRPSILEPLVQHGQHEQRQERGAQQASDHDGREQ